MTKKNIVLSLLVLLTVATIMGGTKYHRYVQTEKFKQAEQKLDETKEAEKLVAALFETEAKETLAKGITEKQLSIALDKVKELPDSPLKKELLTEVKAAEEGYQAQKVVQSLLTDNVLADEVSESQLEQAQTHLEKIKKRFPLLHDELKASLTEAKDQYEAIKKAEKALAELFEEPKTEIVKEDVTQVQYDEVKAMIAAIKNKKVQTALFETLALVETKLSVIEEQLLQEQEEQERVLEEEQERLAEQERMEAIEKEAALQEESEQEEASTSTSVKSSTTNQNTWQPAPKTTKSPQSNWTAPQKDTQEPELPAKENSSETADEPEDSSDPEIPKDSEVDIDSGSNDKEEMNQESSAFSSAE
ncbi:MAG: hypothetical protein RR725_05710 [Carnobacterium sp.]|uniref:hypothetical protein n=2 Tax=Carnobacterium sp. TaxID=48221 RepID=UPI002FC79EBC